MLVGIFPALNGVGKIWANYYWAIITRPYTPQRDNVGEFLANFRRPKMISFCFFWLLNSIF